MVDMGDQTRKLMTRQLEKMVAVAVQEKDASLTKKVCRERLAEVFGEARVEEHKAHIAAEVVRMVTEFRELEAEALGKIVEESQGVTEEEVAALDAEGGGKKKKKKQRRSSGPRRSKDSSEWAQEYRERFGYAKEARQREYDHKDLVCLLYPAVHCSAELSCALARSTLL